MKKEKIEYYHRLKMSFFIVSTKVYFEDINENDILEAIDRRVEYLKENPKKIKELITESGDMLQISGE